MPVTNYVLGKVDDPADMSAIREVVASCLPNALEYVDAPVRKCVGAHLDLYVTGLTSVAIEAVNFCHQNGIAVSTWHYDDATGGS